jgi:hypothetical protein
LSSVVVRGVEGNWYKLRSDPSFLTLVVVISRRQRCRRELVQVEV